MTSPEILASFYTLAGLRPGPYPSVSPWSAIERIQAAGEAGFRGFGFMDEDFEHWLDIEGAGAIGQALTDAGISDGELELKQPWWSPDLDVADHYREHFAIAAGYGFSVVKVFAVPGNDTVTERQYADSLRRLGEVAGRHGLRVGFEFLPFSSVRTLDAAVRIVTAADSPQVGLTLDIWHVARSNTDYAAVGALPGELVVRVELNDAAAELRGSTMAEDSIDHRLSCGRGDLRVAEFVRAVLATGYSGQFGVEILGAAHRALPLAEAAREAYETTRSVLGAS